MEDKTLGELAATVGRYKAQLVPIVLLVLIAVFLDGKPDHLAAERAQGTANQIAAATSGGPPVGPVSVPPALTGPAIPDTDVLAADLSAAGAASSASDAATGGIDVEAPIDSPPIAVPPAPITCANDASLPMPVIAPAMEQLRAAQAQIASAAGPLPVDIAAYVAGAADCSPGIDPLSLVVEQLGPVLSAAGPYINMLGPVNDMLPALPTVPYIPIPALPAELNPVLAAVHPVTGEACGQLGIAPVGVAAIAAFPTPLTSAFLYALLNPVFSTCYTVNPPA